MAPKALNALKLSGYYLSIWKIMPEFTADLVYGQRLWRILSVFVPVRMGATHQK